ncbi:MAG TPA: vitamin K epoxide reductase family protein, partial [Gemmatimonadales bacterium]|nr:vitamin K epoxide reductase family protein [Gemmatimonadales bacterium]
MTRRMGIALLSLVGLFVAMYLWLFKIGVVGTMSCGTGGCETVQLSPESVFMGIEVALIGVVGYLV